MCSPLSSAQVQANAIRLLEQSTFGPNDALLVHVQSVGAQAFLNEQFAAPASQYPAIKYVPAGQQATFCPTDPDPQCGRDYYSLQLAGIRWCRIGLPLYQLREERLAQSVCCCSSGGNDGARLRSSRELRARPRSALPFSLSTAR